MSIEAVEKKIALLSTLESEWVENFAVTHAITQNSEGLYVFETGEDAESYLNLFSLMKHGYLPAVRSLAREMTQTALANPAFLTFLLNSNGSQVYICSPEIYNVPSSSNLLLKEVAKQLNIYLSRNGLPTILIRELVKEGESALGYADSTVDQRISKQTATVPLPLEFAGHSVIYLDDVWISGASANRHKQRLIQEGNVAKVFLLLSSQVDHNLVTSSDGKIEDSLNRVYVDGTILSGMLTILRGEFEPVQKTLRVLLNPENIQELYQLNQYLPFAQYGQVLSKIYGAAAQNDFWNRYQKKYQPALTFIEKELRMLGLIDAQGLLCTFVR